MNLNQYLTTFGFGTVVAWIAWAVVLLNIDPAATSAPGFILFYVTLFASLTGTLTILATLFRVRRYPKEDFEAAISRSLRQAVILALILIVALILASQTLLTWWTLLLLILLTSFLEFFFLGRSRKTA